ncbi:MAG: nitrile hydratase accessory protein [Pseudomonadota bacterium]
MSPGEIDGPDLDDLPQLKRDEDGAPMFAAPWEAKAFALAVSLCEQGVFTWPQWCETFGSVLQEAGSDDRAQNYYRHWMTALERISATSTLVSDKELNVRTAQWDRAARATPHGKPIELANDPQA